LELKKSVAELLATTSSQELTEWGQFFEWREQRQTEEREFSAKVAAAERYVNEGK
jgi:hypothetical protein